MKKARLFVNKDMTVIDLGQDSTYANFHSFDCDVVIANVVKIEERDDGGAVIHTDFRNPFRDKCSVFLLNADNFLKVKWIEN